MLNTMKNRRGFTVVELIVTITIMVILMTLVVARMINTQAAGRDQERGLDMTALHNGLEAFYTGGNQVKNIPKGFYPGRQQIQTAASSSPPFSELLDGVPKSVFMAPRRTITDSFGVDPAGTPVVGSNADGSYDDSQARALLEDTPYLYQPLRRDNGACVSYADCVKYNLYYITETDDELHIIRSKNQ